MNDFPRITQNPGVMGETLHPWPARHGRNGRRTDRVQAGRLMMSLPDYPYLQRDDVFEALRYAAWRAEEREIELANP